MALTDIARLVRAQQPEEAFEYLSAAAHKYAQSLAVHSDNPQARAVGVPLAGVPWRRGRSALLLLAARPGGRLSGRGCSAARPPGVSGGSHFCSTCLQVISSRRTPTIHHRWRPQANNNWGLALQDISGLRPPSERGAYLRHSLSKFRRAIRLRPDFDRACYNLGELGHLALGGWLGLGGQRPLG